MCRRSSCVYPSGLSKLFWQNKAPEKRKQSSLWSRNKINRNKHGGSIKTPIINFPRSCHCPLSFFPDYSPPPRSWPSTSRSLICQSDPSGEADEAPSNRPYPAVTKMSSPITGASHPGATLSPPLPFTPALHDAFRSELVSGLGSVHTWQLDTSWRIQEVRYHFPPCGVYHWTGECSSHVGSSHGVFCFNVILQP